MTPSQIAFLSGWTPEPVYCDRCYLGEKLAHFVCEYCLKIESKYFGPQTDEDYDFTKVVEAPF